MNTLKQVIHYPDTNSVEATWVDSKGVVVKCHSYADVQMQMFRDDVGIYGGNISDYEELIMQVEAGIVPIEEPLPTVPQEVSRAQALIALELAGLLSGIETYMLTAPKVTQIAWASVQVFNRQSPLLASLAATFNLDSAALDSLFISASEVVI